MIENKEKDKEMKDLHALLLKESKKVENYKHKVIKESGSVMVVEEELDINALNDLGVQHAVSKKEIDDMRTEVEETRKKIKEVESNASVRDVKQ